jgi:subtilase family serine protease
VVLPFTTPAAANSGQTISVSFTTKNQGPATTATGSYTAYYLSSNSTFETTDQYLNYSYINTLSGGASNTNNVSLTIPVGTASGTYYILAVVDANNNVAESNKDNNVTPGNIITLGQ